MQHLRSGIQQPSSKCQRRRTEKFVMNITHCAGRTSGRRASLILMAESSIDGPLLLRTSAAEILLREDFCGSCHADRGSDENVIVIANNTLQPTATAPCHIEIGIGSGGQIRSRFPDCHAQSRGSSSGDASPSTTFQ